MGIWYEVECKQAKSDTIERKKIAKRAIEILEKREKNKKRRLKAHELVAKLEEEYNSNLARSEFWSMLSLGKILWSSNRYLSLPPRT